MFDHRILIVGNSGSGKTTMAHALHERRGLPHLDLDAVAWCAPGERRPLAESIAELRTPQRAHSSWVTEGSYGSLVEAALLACTELRFLNPGVETCVRNCRRRPWEPEKYASSEEQDARLDLLLDWVRRYDVREDKYGLARHRALFDSFAGQKREYTDLPSCPRGDLPSASRATDEPGPQIYCILYLIEHDLAAPATGEAGPPDLAGPSAIP